MAQGMVTYANTRHVFSAEWQYGWRHVEDPEWEATPLYEYYINRFSTVFVGVDLAGMRGEGVERHEGILGFRYLLPLNISSRVWVDTEGEFQLGLGKHLELTPRLAIYSEAEYDTTMEAWEVRAGSSYQISNHFSAVGQWHSEFGWGGGLRWEF
jgi:hypothetical protein